MDEKGVVVTVTAVAGLIVGALLFGVVGAVAGATIGGLTGNAISKD